MRQGLPRIIPNLIEKHYQRLADAWLATQKRDGVVRGQITEGQLAEQSRRFLGEFRKGVAVGLFDDISGPESDSTRDLLDTVAGERAVQGFSPSEKGAAIRVASRRRNCLNYRPRSSCYGTRSWHCR